MTGARYVLVDVHDLAVLLRTAHAQEQYDGAVLDRCEAAPIVTVPATVRLNEDGGVWITPDEPAPDPRRSNVLDDPTFDDGPMGWATDQRKPLAARLADQGLRSNVPSQAPPPPLPQLDDHDPAHGHVRAPHGSDQYHRCINGRCNCAMKMYLLALATRKAYEAQPARMVFTPAEPEGVRTYGVRRDSHLGAMVSFLNDHRECQPVAMATDSEGFVLLYVQVVRDPRPKGCTCARTAGDGSDRYNDPACPVHGLPERSPYGPGRPRG